MLQNIFSTFLKTICYSFPTFFKTILSSQAVQKQMVGEEAYRPVFADPSARVKGFSPLILQHADCELCYQTDHNSITTSISIIIYFYPFTPFKHSLGTYSNLGTVQVPSLDQ